MLPGISGATVALMFGVYEKILNFLTKFRDLNLIIPLLVGMVLSVFLFSSLVNFLYTNFTQAFNIFIAFLMIGYGIFLLINTYLKENINKVGKSPQGHNIYEFNYIGDTQRYRGVMAQDVVKVHPMAVEVMDNGYLGVKYAMIDVNMEEV